MPISRVYAILMGSAIMASALSAVAAENPPAVDANTACAGEFVATTIDGDPNAVVARALNLAGPFAGTITAYGADRMWTATIQRSALVDKRFGGREASVTVRAEGPIEGLVYAPAWATCTFHAGARPRSGYEARDVERPVLVVGTSEPVERTNCDHPYVSPTVLHAIEPVGVENVTGEVHVAVALDERGVPRFSRIAVSSAPILNIPATNAAMHSQYRGAIFRCKPVPSGYEFSVAFVG